MYQDYIEGKKEDINCSSFVSRQLNLLKRNDGREIHPVEARLDIDDIEDLTLSVDEVAEVFLLPLVWLRENPTVQYDLAETSDEDLPDKLLGYLSHYGSYREYGETDWMEYEGHGIWGLTARILTARFKQ